MENFMTEQKRKWFGTDGIRGAFGRDPMSPGFIYRVGFAAAEYFSHLQTSPLIVLGRDTRESGPILEQALTRGLLDGGARVHAVGVLPTAAVSLLTVKHQAAAGVMMSASHNEFSDNGVKFFGPQGYKLSDEEEWALEKRIEQQAEKTEPMLVTQEIPSFQADPESLSIYHQTLRQVFPPDFSLAGMKVWVDAAHRARHAFCKTGELRSRC
jgi:phosphoglucosamine mutase